MPSGQGLLSIGGAWVMAAAALAGAGFAVAAYFNWQSGIAGEPGTILVIVSSLLIALVAVAKALDRPAGGFLRGLLSVATLLGIIGTASAAYLLHSEALLACMGVAAAGWLVHHFGRPSRF
jgi:hypothetical protein